MSKLLLIVTLFCGQFTLTFARKPAVDPIIGSSIEEYKEVPPEKAKGYDFSQKREVASRAHSPDKLKEGSTTDSEGSTNLLIVFFIFLPIIASGMTFYLLRKNKIVRSDFEDNLHSIRGKKSDENDDNDIDFPKAS